MAGPESNGHSSDDPLLQVEGLTKHFPIKKGLLQRTVGQVRAVDGVSFDIAKGETLALVGESGCGKTTTGRVILHLLEPTAGTVRFKDQDLADLSADELRRLRQRIQIIFQDPYSSLDPRMSTADIVGEGLDIHGLADGQEQLDRVTDLLERVGLSARDLRKFPHQFSGGQRQRIGVARALALEPKVIFCDEPVSALDVSIQAQIINLLKDLQQKLGLALIFIAHDLSVVRHISDRVMVMYMGQAMEVSKKSELYLRPLHPYTNALMKSVPLPDPKLAAEARRESWLTGDMPSPYQRPRGCIFNNRCPFKVKRCEADVPALRRMENGDWVACHRAEELDLSI